MIVAKCRADETQRHTRARTRTRYRSRPLRSRASSLAISSGALLTLAIVLFRRVIRSDLAAWQIYIADASRVVVVVTRRVGDSFYFDVRSRSDFFLLASPSPHFAFSPRVVAPRRIPLALAWRRSPFMSRTTVDSLETGTNLRGAMGGSSLSTSGECDTERRRTRRVRFFRCSLPSSISIRSRNFFRFFQVLPFVSYRRCAKPRNRITARSSQTTALVIEF